MTKEQKQAQINVLKAELCILYMMWKLKPDVGISETIMRAMKGNAIILDIWTIQSQPMPKFKKGLAIVGDKSQKEIILNDKRRTVK